MIDVMFLSNLDRKVIIGRKIAIKPNIKLNKLEYIIVLP